MFSHRVEERDQRLLDVLTDDERGLRIIVSRLGAELISLARRDARGEWAGFLYRDNDIAAPASGWANHATVMGYYLHRLKNERSLYRGEEIRGGTHGFLRGKEWHVVRAAESALTYRITPADFSRSDYPLQVSVELSYELVKDDVRVGFTFRNDETELSAHVGFGLHPGFATSAFGSFRFEMPAGIYRRHFSPNNYLSGETETIDFAGGEMPFAKEKLRGSFILEFVDVPDRQFRFIDEPSGRCVELGLSEVPYLTLWSDGGPFFCAEPCWGLTDHDEQRPFEQKEGIQEIAPRSERRASFAMRPGFVAAGG